MNSVPINTWNPWKPVPKKKHDPYTPSAIVNPAFTYSTPCRAVNRIANTNVIVIPNNVAFRSP